MDVVLFDLLLGPAERRPTALARALDPAGAEEIVERALARRVAPQLRQRISESGEKLPAAAARRLHEIVRSAGVRSTLIVHRAAFLAGALAERGIIVAAFKGVGLIGNLYRDPSRRMTADIDLLIAETDLADAFRLLGELGFSAEADPNDLLDAMRREAFPTHRFCVFSDGRAEVDLHWQINNAPPPPLEVEHLLERAEEVELGGGRLRVVAPPDALLLTVHHIIRESFRPETTIKDLCDVAAWMSEPAVRWSPTDVLDRARRSSLAPSLLACWKLVGASGGSRGAEIDSILAGASPVERRAADRLASVFRMQLSGGDVNDDLLKLMSFSSIRRYVAQRTRTPGQNRKLRRIARARAPERPAGWRRLAAIVRAVATLPGRRFAAYRALAAQQDLLRRP